MHWNLSFPIGVTLAVLAGLLYGLVKDKPADLLFVGAVVLLAALRVITPEEAFSGFANSGVLIVAALFVVAAGLRETGVMEYIGERFLGRVETEGRALIIGQGGAIRATAGLVGHGACVLNGRRVLAASYSTRDAGWETNPACYAMSEALKPFNGRKYWEEAAGKWMGHDIADATKFRHSAAFQRVACLRPTAFLMSVPYSPPSHSAAKSNIAASPCAAILPT